MNAPFAWPVRIYYEDTDAGGVVYHSRYLNLMERARTEWLRALGVEQEALYQATGIRFAVTRMAVDFKKPARLDDQVEVTVALLEQRRASLLLQQEIRREGDQTVLIASQVRIAAIDAGFRPTRLPEVVASVLLTGKT